MTTSNALSRSTQPSEVLLVDLVEIADLSGIDRRQTKVAHERTPARQGSDHDARAFDQCRRLSPMRRCSTSRRRHSRRPLGNCDAHRLRAGRRLHDAVGVVARHSGIDEGEEHGLGEDEPEGAGREVLEARSGSTQGRWRDQWPCATYIRELQRVGSTTFQRSNARCHARARGDVLESGLQVSPQYRRAAQSFRENGLRLCGIADDPSGDGEGLFGLAHFTASQVAHFECELFDRGASDAHA